MLFNIHLNNSSYFGSFRTTGGAGSGSVCCWVPTNVREIVPKLSLKLSLKIPRKLTKKLSPKLSQTLVPKIVNDIFPLPNNISYFGSFRTTGGAGSGCVCCWDCCCCCLTGKFEAAEPPEDWAVEQHTSTLPPLTQLWNVNKQLNFWTFIRVSERWVAKGLE